MDSSNNWPNYFKSKGCGNSMRNVMVKKKRVLFDIVCGYMVCGEASKVRVLLKHGPQAGCRLSVVSGETGSQCQDKNSLMVKHTPAWLTSSLCSRTSLRGEQSADFCSGTLFLPAVSWYSQHCWLASCSGSLRQHPP